MRPTCCQHPAVAHQGIEEEAVRLPLLCEPLAVAQPFELYPLKLRQRLPRLRVPLAEGDPDTTLDLQAALEQVYLDGRYHRRIRYSQECKPR